MGRKVGEAIGVDEFHYNDVEGLAEAIGLPRSSMCFACVTGDYSKLGVSPDFRSTKEMKQ
jgi:amidophosphoribosyltransferase